MMTDHQYVVMANEWVFGILNIALTVLFINLFGIVGAALASAGVLALRNLVKVLEVWHFEGLTPYSRSFYKPLVAGVVAALIMVGSTYLFSPLVAVGVGVITATLAYVAVLALLGLERIDREVYQLLTTSGETAAATQ